jgi:hypothetical protein
MWITVEMWRTPEGGLPEEDPAAQDPLAVDADERVQERIGVRRGPLRRRVEAGARAG